ncbi:hypothetical protein ACWGOQ_0016375 [Aquimarina sp. M1]
MKPIKNVVLIILTILWLTSCGRETSSHPTTIDGFSAIEQDLKDKFGNDAYYTDLNISHTKDDGIMISLTVTENPASLKMGQFVYSSDTSWRQNTEITLEVPQGTQAADYMFQLSDDINLKKLGELIETSKKRLIEEKNMKNPHMELAFIKLPKNGALEKAKYIIKLEPENGGTSFTFSYSLDGSFIDMDY